MNVSSFTSTYHRNTSIRVGSLVGYLSLAEACFSAGLGEDVVTGVGMNKDGSLLLPLLKSAH
jgi:hypothetical protein